MNTTKHIDKQIIQTIGVGELTASEIARKTGFGRTTLNLSPETLTWRKIHFQIKTYRTQSFLFCK